MWEDLISPSVDDISTTRGAVADHLEAVGATEEIEVVVLLVSELVSNAVLHGTGARSIAIEVTPTVIHVEVADEAHTDPVVQPVDMDRIGGNGMRIVDSLASAWGVHHVPDDGKRVWFDLLRATSSDSAFA